MIVAISSVPAPVVIPQKGLGTAKANEGGYQATVEQRPPEAEWNRWYDHPVDVFTFVLCVATVLLGVSTTLLWLTTQRIAKDSEASGKTQADKMERSIAEAAKAAEAMEGVSASMKINAAKIVESVGYQETFGQMQMRAYVSVLLDGIYQDDTHIFEARPVLRNTGHTPAHAIKWRIKADILPVPLPDDFDFPLPDDTPGAGILNPQQTGFMSAFLDVDKFPDRRVPEAEMEAIKQGNERGFYTWGIATYRDAFGIDQYTKFAHLLMWHPTPKVDDKGKPIFEGSGRYLPRHNEAS